MTQSTLTDEKLHAFLRDLAQLMVQHGVQNFQAKSGAARAGWFPASDLDFHFDSFTTLFMDPSSHRASAEAAGIEPK